MPSEVENLLDIARIKNLARELGIIKISQKQDGVVFLYSKDKFNFENINDLIEKYSNRIKFSQGIEPYVTLKIKKDTEKQFLKEIKDYLKS